MAKGKRRDKGEGYARACIAHELGVEVVQHDNLEKLARSGYDRRHLFIGFPGFDDCPASVTMAMSDCETALPTRPPQLPSEVTDIWLAGGWSSGPGLRWSAETGWKYFDKLTARRPNLTRA